MFVKKELSGSFLFGRKFHHEDTKARRKRRKTIGGRIFFVVETTSTGVSKAVGDC